MTNLNSQDFRLSDNQSAFLKSVASMTYGTGFLEGKGGGKGNIGLWADSQGQMRVVKFNTHSTEADRAQKALDRGVASADENLKNMLSASDALRVELKKIAVSLGMSTADQEKFLGRANDPPRLLTRRIVARFISAAQASAMAGRALDDIWSGGAAFSSRSDMSFKTVTGEGNLEKFSCTVQRGDEDAWQLYQALDSICTRSVDKSDCVKANVTFEGKPLFLKVENGEVKYQYAADASALGDGWQKTGVSAYDLRSRMVHEILSAGGGFRTNAGRVLDSLLEKLDHAPVRRQAQFREDCVFYLKARTGLLNDNFSAVSTKRLLYLARVLAETGDDAVARDLAKAKLTDYVQNADAGLVNSKDALALLDAAKAELNTKKVVFASSPKQDQQPKTESSEKFRRLAADMVKLADSTDVDASLNSDETEEKIREERAYVDEQMKILDMSAEELEKSPEEVQARHKALTEKLASHRKSVQTIPNELLARRIERMIRGDENYVNSLTNEKLASMQAAFDMKHKPADGVTLKVGKKVFDSADGNEIVVAWMKDPKPPHQWWGTKNLQRVPLLEALKGMFGENEYGIELSLVDPHAPGDTFDRDAARKLLDACKAKKADEVRPQWKDAHEAVLQDLPRYVQSTFFGDDGALKQDLSPQDGLYSKAVLSAWKKELSKEFVEIESRDLLRRELLSERPSGGVEDAADGLRVLETIKRNQDALADLIVQGKDALPCSGDDAANGMLSILAKHGGLCAMLGIGEAERRDVNLCKQKIAAFVENPKIDKQVVRELNGQVRTFVGQQLALAQDAFNQLVDKVYAEEKDGFAFNPDRVRLVKGTNDAYRLTLHEIQDRFKAYSDDAGYGKFLRTVLKSYFNELPLQLRLNLVSSRLRLSHDDATPSEQLGALLKGAGPLLQKMLQAFDPKQDPVLKAALQDVKTNLNPIPQSMLQAHLLDVVNRSGGRIESITVKKTLGCASVGQTLLCRVEGPGVKDGGVDVVVKVLRPDALNQLRRERDFMMRCARKAGMESSYASIVDKILEEFDLTLEAKNVEACKVYNGVFKGVQTLNALPLVGAAPGTLLLELAPGQTLDGIFKDIDGMKSTYNDKYGISYGIKMVHTPPTYEAHVRKIQKEREGVDKYHHVKAADQRKHFQAVKNKVDELRKAYGHLSDLARAWIAESCTEGGSGFYHGDLHAGNIMIDAERGLTAIDVGNVSTFGKTEKEDFFALLKMCNQVPPDFADTYRGDKMTPAWVDKNLSPLADQFCERLLKMLPADQAEKLRAKYYDDSGKMVTEEGCTPSEFTSLKHEFMVILSSSSFDPSPFERLSMILNRLEYQGFRIPESISRFLSSALRLQKEVNNMVSVENDIYGTMKDFALYTIGKTPRRFSILGAIKAPYDSKTDTYEQLPKLGQKKIASHQKDLESEIRNGWQIGKSKWQQIKKDVKWLEEQPINDLLEALEKNYSEEGVQKLAKAICDYEVQEYERMAMVYEEELGKGKRPGPMNLDSFETIFNQVVSTGVKRSNNDGKVLVKV